MKIWTVRIVNLPSVVQSEFNEATRILFVRKENKNDFIQQYSSPLLQCSAILENIHWMQAACKQLWHRTAYTACVQRIFSKMALRWSRGDGLLNKVIVFVFFVHKKCSRCFIKFRWRMDYSKDVFHTFLGIDSVIYLAVNETVTNLPVFIQNILNCVPKMNKAFTGLERHGGKWLMTTF